MGRLAALYGYLHMARVLHYLRILADSLLLYVDCYVCCIHTYVVSPITIFKGKVEVEDQVAGLQYIADKTGLVDMNRIGVTGWSYGGYMSLMCLALRPDVFKVRFVHMLNFPYVIGYVKILM